jgi:hypothetical protein
MTENEAFSKYGAVYIKDAVSQDLCKFLTGILLRSPFVGYGRTEGDQQVPNAYSVIAHEIIFETLLERLWPSLEFAVGEELLPTYSYARLYSNGDELKPHKDRPACEISVTVQLGRSHNYAWPIYMGSKRFDIAEGDAVLYKGCDIEHWRNVCDGPEGYYSGQVFLHYVRKNGKHADEFGDQKNTRKINDSHFVKYRTLLMEQK